METCKICKSEQGLKHYKGYNICTECANLVEELLNEYFLRTISDNVETKKGYLKYLENAKEFISNYPKIRKHSKRHIKHMEEHVHEEMRDAHGGKQRYLERLLQTINWLEHCPEFYNYYFRDYYVCPGCGSSIFEYYDKQEVSDWIMVTCSKCDEVIKKYLLPKFMIK